MSRPANRSPEIEDSNDIQEDVADAASQDEDDPLPLGDKRSPHSLFDFGDDETADFDEEDFDDEFDDDFEEEDEEFAADDDTVPENESDFAGFGSEVDVDDDDASPVEDD